MGGVDTDHFVTSSENYMNIQRDAENQQLQWSQQTLQTKYGEILKKLNYNYDLITKPKSIEELAKTLIDKLLMAEASLSECKQELNITKNKLLITKNKLLQEQQITKTMRETSLSINAKLQTQIIQLKAALDERNNILKIHPLQDSQYKVSQQPYHQSQFKQQGNQTCQWSKNK